MLLSRPSITFCYDKIVRKGIREYWYQTFNKYFFALKYTIFSHFVLCHTQKQLDNNSKIKATKGFHLLLLRVNRKNNDQKRKTFNRVSVAVVILWFCSNNHLLKFQRENNCTTKEVYSSCQIYVLIYQFKRGNLLFYWIMSTA